MSHEWMGTLRPCPCGAPDCPASRWVDLGCGAAMRWHLERARLMVRHLVPEPGRPPGFMPGAECHALIVVDTPEGLALRAAEGPGPTWHVETWEPLTLSPSIACSCGSHGFIREGRWVPA